MKRMSSFEKLLREVKNYPKEGITFYDIDPLLNNATAFNDMLDKLVEEIQKIDVNIDLFAGPEARGFLFASGLAVKFKSGVALVRKPGKLPAEKITEQYNLEYGTNSVEMHTTAVKPNQTVVVVDDLLATGGTIEAAIKLITKLGGRVVGVAVLVELEHFGGKQRLEKTYNIPVIRFDIFFF